MKYGTIHIFHDKDNWLNYYYRKWIWNETPISDNTTQILIHFNDGNVIDMLNYTPSTKLMFLHP